MSKNKYITSIVVAVDNNNGIGKNNTIPWYIKEDLKFFKRLTTYNRRKDNKNVVLMGRKTWESIPEKFRPLENRYNIVLSNNNYDELIKLEKEYDNFKVLRSIEEVYKYIDEELLNIENLFIIGGHQLYKQVINDSKIEMIYYTKINKDYECDVYFPKIPLEYVDVGSSKLALKGIQKDNEVEYEFKLYVNRIYKKDKKDKSLIKNEEDQYLELIEEIIEKGNKREDRTKVGTLSLFGKTMRFSLENNVIPLLTTKRVFWRGVVEELLWFISGSTDANILKNKGIYIWDGNTSREYLDSLGLIEYKEGELGPGYGFQWRHFGAEYKGLNEDYTNQGIDQIKDIINKIKTDPTNRRIILTAWNPKDLNKMALSPCHILAQFYVNNNELSCQMYQRSADVGLGVPFNIASYSLLTHMIAKSTGLKAKEFIYVMGDVHIYLNHVEELKYQLKCTKYEFPIIIMKEGKDIEDIEYEDIELIGYTYDKTKIKMEMAV